MLLAKIQQKLFEKGKSSVQKTVGQHKQNVHGQRGGHVNPTLWKEKQVKNYRREHNLCYFCGEAYSPAHVAECAKRPKAQANALVVNGLDMHLSEEVLEQLALENALSDEFCQLSLNAVSGTEGGETMKIRAMVKNQVMLTLIDSGSNHSFVSEAFLAKVGIIHVSAPSLQVRVDNGDMMVSDKCVPHLSWWCDGATLSTSMRVLNLGAYDTILGYDWLKSHSPMQCHWNEKWLEFSANGKLVRLQGVQAVGASVQAMSANQLVKCYKGNDIWAMVLVTQEIPTGSEDSPEEVKALLDQYKDVFDDPKTLPPSIYPHPELMTMQFPCYQVQCR